MADLRINQLDDIEQGLQVDDLFVVKMKRRGTAIADEDRKVSWTQVLQALNLGQYLPNAGGNVTGEISLANNTAITGKRTGSASPVKLIYVDNQNSIVVGDPAVQHVVASSAVPIWQNNGNTYNIITTNNLPAPGSLSGGGAYTKAEVTAALALKFDKTGGSISGDIVLNNSKSIQGRDSNGTGHFLLYMDTANIIHVGDYSFPLSLDSSAVPVWTSTAGSAKIFTELNVPTTTQLGIENRLKLADTALQDGAYGLGAVPKHRKDASFLTTNDETEFFVQSGASDEQCFGGDLGTGGANGLGTGIHIYYGSVGTGNATQYKSASLFLREDNKFVMKWSYLDYTGQVIDTKSAIAYTTLNKPTPNELGVYSKTESDAKYAKVGSNSDITSLNGLTGALKVGANALNPLEVTTLQQVQAMTSGTAGAVVGVVGGYIGAVMWFNGADRSKIPAGWVAADGQLLNRTDYPDLWAAVNTGSFPYVTEAIWVDSTDTVRPYAHRAKYSTGNGSSTFRVPDMNGMQSNSIKHLFVSGSSGAVNEPSVNQVWLQSSPNASGSFYTHGTNDDASSSTGVFSFGEQDTGSRFTVSGNDRGDRIDFNLYRSSKTYGRGTEYQTDPGGTGAVGDLYPNHIPGIWIIRASNSFEAANTEFNVYTGVVSDPAIGNKVTTGVLRGIFNVGGISRITSQVYGEYTWYQPASTASTNIDVAVFDPSGAVTVNATFKHRADGSFIAPGMVCAGLPDFNTSSNKWQSQPLVGSYMMLNPDGVSSPGIYVHRLDGVTTNYLSTLTLEYHSGLNQHRWQSTEPFGGDGFVANSVYVYTSRNMSSEGIGHGTATVNLSGNVEAKPFWANYHSNTGNWTLQQSFGAIQSYDGSANLLSHSFTMTDGGGFTRTWYMRNDGLLTSPSGCGIKFDLGPGDYPLSQMINASDLRLKDDINDYNGQQSLDNINSMNFKTYVMKTDDSRTVRRGVIAQEIAEIDPQYVHDNGNILTLNNNQLLMDALAAIKVLSAKVAQLESQLSTK